MKTSIKTILVGLLTFSMLVSCNNGPSLQTYFVDNQESPDFITADLPTSVVTLDEETMSDEQKEAYKSLKRLNFLENTLQNQKDLLLSYRIHAKAPKEVRFFSMRRI